MPRLFLFLFVLEIILAASALISLLSVEDGEIRGLPKIVWVIVILLFPLIGSIAWFLAGRPTTVTPPKDTWRPGRGFPEAERPRRPAAPDDDPDFLRSIKRDDEELFTRWEEDLRRREDDLRKREKKSDEDG